MLHQIQLVADHVKKSYFEKCSTMRLAMEYSGPAEGLKPSCDFSFENWVKVERHRQWPILTVKILLLHA